MAIYVYNEALHREWGRQLGQLLNPTLQDHSFEARLQELLTAASQLAACSTGGKRSRRNAARFVADGFIQHASICAVRSEAMQLLVTHRAALGFANVRQRAMTASWLVAWARGRGEPVPEWAEAFIADFVRRTRSVREGSPAAERLAPLRAMFEPWMSS